MNSVAHRWRMARYLLLTPQNIINFLIFAPAVTFNAATVGGWWGLLLIVIYPVLRPTWEPYEALGLNKATWRRHRRLAVTAVAPLLLLEVALLSPADPRWVLPSSILALWLIAMVWPGQPTRSIERLLVSGDTPSESTKSAIIYRPQALTWLMTWGGGLALLLLLAALFYTRGSFLDGAMQVRLIVWLATIVGSLFGMSAIGRSLRDWQSMGGTRKDWASASAFAGLLSVGFSVLVAGVDHLLLFPGHLDESLSFVVLGFLAPLFALTLELTDRRTWPVALLLSTAAGGLALSLLFGLISGWVGVAAAATFYLAFSVWLPTMARRFTPFGGGMSDWLGLNAKPST
ncbi:hypothetical protein CATRI_12710 [Corynebacterium atrinae]|uniref:hypothetical protein n=1 Tax=Corynebacterium atrinae TaxID=1336740 RepID=UPI0025B5FE40|nr:hypothetical protein [Corynebacterium atrinae]WJY64587.1 hypothetical protein CATRI_12710 [Corynebacterium atrinae]